MQKTMPKTPPPRKIQIQSCLFNLLPSEADAMVAVAFLVLLQELLVRFICRVEVSSRLDAGRDSEAFVGLDLLS